MPPIDHYGVLSQMTKSLFDAFKRLGVKCRLLVAQRDNPEPFVDTLFNDPPDCTLSFNGLLPDSKGNFFCEMIKIPHVAYLVNYPVHFVALAQSPMTIVVCPDAFGCQFFLGLNSDRVLFMPHGVDKNIALEPSKEKKYDVVMLASCIDYLKIRTAWKKKYPQSLFQALENAAEQFSSHLAKSLVEVLAESLNEQLNKGHNGFDPSQINMLELLDELATFVKGRDRVELLKAIKNCKIDIFGAPSSTAGWEIYLKGNKVKIHDPIPYETAIDVMNQSKIVLASCPDMKNGGDQRVFAPLACGAAVLTSENVYLKENFHEGSDILFYTPGKWNAAGDLVQEFLANPEKLKKIGVAAKENVLNNHVWDVRASHLLKSLPPLLHSLKLKV